jgi:hypothetical protein
MPVPQIAFGTQSQTPYLSSSSGPSYNEKSRVSNKERKGGSRSYLNSFIRQKAIELRDSEPVKYFDQYKLREFIDIIRNVSGIESKRNSYDRDLDAFERRTPSTEDTDRFKQIVLSRSLNRMLNAQWRTAFPNFFNRVELVGSYSQTASNAFHHNSNRAMWNQDLLNKSVSVVGELHKYILNAFIERKTAIDAV